MDKPLLMLTLPNSGSTWFAAAIAKHLPGCRYYDKEFFNPVCNLKHEVVLRRNFGSELVSCYRNIALPGDGAIDDDIRATWGSENYTFTKECQSAFKLPVFMRHFQCFAFLRSADDTFPPRRARVWSFYEHAWFALRDAGYDALVETTLQGRAREAHATLQARIQFDADALGVPLLWHRELFSHSFVVRERLRGALGWVSDALVEEIFSTRQSFARPGA